MLFNSDNSIKVAWEAEREVAFGDITSGYVALGDPYFAPVRNLVIQNGTDANVAFSFDGVTQNLTVFAGVSMTFDYCSNKNESGGDLSQQKGTQIYIKYKAGAPSSGSVCVATFYASSR
jgi:hypothetical protein